MWMGTSVERNPTMIMLTHTCLDGYSVSVSVAISLAFNRPLHNFGKKRSQKKSEEGSRCLQALGKESKTRREPEKYLKNSRVLFFFELYWVGKSQGAKFTKRVGNFCQEELRKSARNLLL